MKRLLLSGAIIFLATGAFAQNKMSGADARIGIKAGVNLAKVHVSGDGSAINDLTKNNVGYNFTVFGDFGVGNNFFIQPGISLQNKGTKLEGTIPSGTGSTITGTNTSNIMALEVPINAVFRIPTGDAGAVQISAGPYVGFNIAGKSKIKVSQGAGSELGTQERDLEFGNKTDDDVASTDFGANFGLAYRLNSGISVGANYGLGLSNLVPKDDRAGNNTKATNRVLGFTVGYSF